MPIIQVECVSKYFALRKDKSRSFQEAVLSFFHSHGHRRAPELYGALQNISFSVEAGEMLGIIGTNGSGKSTLLKLLTRIIEPTSGKITVKGRVSALLELGAGFHPELTGRENIYLYGSVLGLKQAQMENRMSEIIKFAELERFIDVPVKFYSSGMYVRLAFAVATSVQPDILLVDEVLAVGDRGFQEKCLERISEMRKQGITIVLISHDLDAIRRMCSRVIWIDQGVMQADGSAELVTTEYLARVHDYEEVKAQAAHLTQRTALIESAAALRQGNIQKPTSDTLHQDEQSVIAACQADEATVMSEAAGPPSKRWGSLEAEITDVLLLDKDGRERHHLLTGEPVTVVIRYTAHEHICQPVFGISFFRSDGMHMCGSNTSTAGIPIEAIEGAGEMEYRIANLPLLEGSYTITAAIHNEDESQVYDYQQCYYPFKVYLGSVKERYGQVYIVGTSWHHHAATAKTLEPGQDAG
ncbi:MAG: ABC transporter ATP-binding protein [Chloroflexi bacterium]|nr:ABC transporter ATP-binding protein [Chloroflexota bacterium]